MRQHVYSYDAEDRLLSVDGSAATYGYFGAVRVGKTVGASTTRYIFSGSRTIAKYVNGALAEEYIYAGGQMLARVQADGTATYRHMDHLSVRAETDAAGNKVHEYGLLPFGDTWYDSGSGPATEWLFTSFQRDAETGLDYSIFRYYSSRLARWTTADPAGMAAADATAPQSWNRYGYVLNDPVSLVDPLGLGDCPAGERNKLGVGCVPYDPPGWWDGPLFADWNRFSESAWLGIKGRTERVDDCDHRKNSTNPCPVEPAPTPAANNVPNQSDLIKKDYKAFQQCVGDPWTPARPLPTWLQFIPTKLNPGTMTRQGGPDFGSKGSGMGPDIPPLEPPVTSPTRDLNYKRVRDCMKMHPLAPLGGDVYMEPGDVF